MNVYMNETNERNALQNQKNAGKGAMAMQYDNNKVVT